MKTPDNISDDIMFLTGLIINSLTKNINKSFREAGIDITIEQFSILALLWYKEGYSQQQIADSIRRDKTTVARVTGNMFEKNLLVKIPDCNDRRKNLIYLTKKGKELQDRCVKITDGYYIKALADISDAEIDKTVKVLNKIAMNIT